MKHLPTQLLDCEFLGEFSKAGLKVIRTSLHKMCHFACGLFWAKSNQDPAGKRHFHPSLNYLEELKLWDVGRLAGWVGGEWRGVVFLRIRITTSDKFYLSDSSIWQGKYLIIKHLLFLLSYELLLLLWNPISGSCSLAQHNIYTLFCLLFLPTKM